MSRWLLWLWLVAMPAAALEITHRPAESGQDQRVNYFVALLALALEKTAPDHGPARARPFDQDRKSTRLNSSHVRISYAVFCLKKKKKKKHQTETTNTR